MLRWFAIGLTVLACWPVVSVPAVDAATPGASVAVADAATPGASVTAVDGDDTNSSKPVDDTAPSSTVSADDPSVVAVYPNPITDGDAGEFVVLDVPGERRISQYTIDDGHRAVRLPNVTASGRLVLTDNRSALPRLVEGTVVELDAWPRLANGGDNLTLRDGDRTLETLRYDRAPEGERARPDGDAVSWQPLGATDYPLVRGNATTVRSFTLPDAPGVPIEVLDAADDRIRLAAYTLTSERVVTSLLAAHRRGVSVEVVLEGAPVGGLSNRSATLADRLVGAGVPVSVSHGPYRFHHAKYAVVDDRAVVLTENWKPAGTGGRSSRGWGVVVGDSAVVAGLNRTFRADTRERHTERWSRYRRNETFVAADPATTTYGGSFEPARMAADSVELLLAPDNAAGRLETLVGNANQSVRIVQVGIGGRDNRLLGAAIAAARRGVDVDILLSSAWYVAEDNRALAANLTALAERGDLPLSVRLAEPGNRFEKIHAKGVIVDGEHVAVGSLNWNDNALENNREVVVLLHGSDVADYYGAVFSADWRGGISRVTFGLLLTLALVSLGAVGIGRLISFGAEHSEENPGVEDLDYTL